MSPTAISSAAAVKSSSGSLVWLTAAVLFASLCIAVTARADTLGDVRARGALRCAIVEGSPGYSTMDGAGQRQGFDIDHCRTISAAVLGRISVEYVPITPQTAFTLLQSGGVDVFPGGATWTFLRDTSMGLDYTGVYLYTGQGFLVRRSSGIHSVAQLDGATICVAQGTTLEQNVADYFRAKGLRYRIVTFANLERGLDAYQADRCDTFTNERASLAGWIRVLQKPEDHVILEEVISREPMAGLVRQGDPRWRDIVLWAFNAQLAAEELGITQANVASVRASTSNGEAQRLLGVTGNFGAQLGLSPDWAYDIIKLVGNYADTWQRNFTPLGLERGPNRLWRDGGLFVPLPFR